jgi:NitT/TauT family transport system ATP-binding protein
VTAIAALRAVEVEYGGRAALGPFDLDLPVGEIVALVGPSGCGKSTALVFQAPTLMPWATALTNAALPLVLAGTPKREAEMRAADALARVGLGQALKLKPAQLSGGMAMRVSLARALVTQPRLLLLDEPFAALDEITRRKLADDVLALWTETRPAIVFVTHNVEEAVYMAARVVVMSSGPGRSAGETTVDGPLPRPAQFRTTEAFRTAAESVSIHLDRAMAGRAA